MSYLNDHKDTDGIKVDAPREGIQLNELGKDVLVDLQGQLKERDQRIVQLTAMCYTLARRLRNESFQDNITAVSRQQMAEMAMSSLHMTAEVWDLVHKSEEAQRQEQ